jgi:signal-transduction protein with cAMP-binding, CBS, and nucleotidyltransferase domain
MNLHEFMHTPAVTCTLATTIADAANLMETHEVGSVVVLDAQGALAGIATDRDLAIRGLGRRREPDTPIEEVMTPNVVFLREDTNVFAAATEMATAHCRRMPVIDMSGRVTGVVSLDDLLTLFARQTDKLAEAVTAEMPHGAPR